MAVPQARIDAYLNRQVDDLSFIKQLPPLEIELELTNINPPVHFTGPLRTDQKACFLLGVAYPEIVLMTDLGLGKTIVSLELFNYFYTNGFVKRGIVFCPTDELVEGWEDEIKKWRFKFPYLSLRKISSTRKWDEFARFTGNGLIIGTYAGIGAMVSELKTVVDRYGKESKHRKRIPQPKLLAELVKNVDAVFFDQCFIGSTTITTPQGETEIQNLRNDDYVLTSDLSFRKIQKVIKKQSQIITHVYLANGQTIITTPDHPFFTDKGWVCAANLNNKVVFDEQSLRALWKTTTSKPESVLQRGMRGKSATKIYMSELWKRIFRPTRSKRTVLQQILLCEIEMASRTRKAYRFRTPSRVDSYIQIPRWQWYTYATFSIAFANRLEPGLDTGVRHFIRPMATRLSQMLQSRFWQPDNQNSNRNRWKLPQQTRSTAQRYEKGQEIKGIRVVSVKTVKHDRPQDVYTLTIDECPHFFADGVLVHNSTRVGNRDTLSFKVCNYISQKCSVRFGLAGRAFGRDPGLLFSQFYLADHGRAFGKGVTLFREAFYSIRENKWGGNEYRFRKRRAKQFAKFVSSSSLRYSVDECVQLPPKIPVTKYCEFPDENYQYYDQIATELLKHRGNYREVKNSFIRMRQIASGFVGFIDDETGDKAQIEFKVNPKLNLLMDVIAELPEDRKAIIIHEFTWTGQRICQELTKAKLKHGWLWGGTTDWSHIKDNLNNNPDYRFLVANWRKASMGLNLQTCSYLIFFESPVAVIERSETEGRIHRTGQLHKCFIYDLVMKDTVDQNILDFHKEGGNLWKVLVEDPQKIIKRRT